MRHALYQMKMGDQFIPQQLVLLAITVPSGYGV
jgi:hypothetical protein